MTKEEWKIQNEKDRKRISNSRKNKNWINEAFNYDCLKEYNKSTDVSIGEMNIVCVYCRSLKFPKEPPKVCCSNGSVSLTPLKEPPEPLLSYVSGNNNYDFLNIFSEIIFFKIFIVLGTTTKSKHFLKHIRQYNSCFQMTSFGATDIIKYPGYMPTFKIQGQIYHRIGSILPPVNETDKFLQIYFLGDENLETDQRLSLKKIFFFSYNIYLRLPQYKLTSHFEYKHWFREIFKILFLKEKELK